MTDGMEDEKFQPGWAGIEAEVSPHLSKQGHQLQFLAGPPACAGVDGKGPAPCP